MACPQSATLHTGAKMPLLGYGTWQAGEGELEAALELALEAGYRHIDTAAMYRNEAVIGNVLQKWLKSGKLKREDLFIVTKLPFSGLRPSGVDQWLQRSLRELQLDYVDLYLIHTPMGAQEQGDELLPKGPDGNFLFDHATDHVATWKAMEAQVEAGRAKAIGLSNFNKRQIQRVLDHCRIKPANLQVELHLHMQQRPLVEFCEKNGITVCAYSPLGSPGSAVSLAQADLKLPNLLADPVVVEVAKKYNVTPGQILLKHIVQRGIVTIPKSTSKERVKQNIQLFHFDLSAEDVARLNALDKGAKGRILDMRFLKGAEEHPEYSFNEYP